MQWETATPVGFPVCMRHNDFRNKSEFSITRNSRTAQMSILQLSTATATATATVLQQKSLRWKWVPSHRDLDHAKSSRDFLNFEF